MSFRDRSTASSFFSSLQLVSCRSPCIILTLARTYANVISREKTIRSHVCQIQIFFFLLKRKKKDENHQMHTTVPELRLINSILFTRAPAKCMHGLGSKLIASSNVFFLVSLIFQSKIIVSK
jgi:hypothetical protein